MCGAGLRPTPRPLKKRAAAVSQKVVSDYTLLDQGPTGAEEESERSPGPYPYITAQSYRSRSQPPRLGLGCELERSSSTTTTLRCAAAAAEKEIAQKLVNHPNSNSAGTAPKGPTSV